ncbi:SusC/RagA family TonB-linked outer membrane protein [Terrimonas alba]|uniref:SusC/RagA family TonB-linked outer membrane protein n=1 Tax=Terrimonas alba TaxID=3349636 RepID=UPI0035F234E7
MPKFLFLSGFLLLMTAAFCQEKELTGTVRSKSTREPLQGVSAQTRNKTVLTDINGKFTIAAVAGETISFSYVGMKTLSIRVDHSTKGISIEMEDDVNNMDEVVVIGYKTERKKDLTGSVAVVNVKEIKDIPSGNPMQALQGRVPGLYIESDGRPNGNNRRILIRGLNTLGNTDPLYVIDGVPTKRPEVFQNLNPEAIESIQILKDASAASIYGARASNGVVIVTTKEAKGKEKLQIQFNSSVTQEKYRSSLDVLNTEQRGAALWRASINDKTDPNIHKALYTFDWHTDPQGIPVLDKVNVVDWIGDPALGVHSANTDWQKVTFRDGIINSNELTLATGSDKSSMLLNVGYFYNKGLVRYSDYKRYNARINTSTKFLKGKLKIGENLQLSKSVETPVPNDLGGASVISLAKFLQPIIPVYTTSGAFAGPPIGAGFSDRNNPLHMLYINRDDKNHLLNVFGNMYAELRLVKNLTLRSNFGLDYASGYNKNIERSFKEGFLSRTVNSLSINQSHRLNLTFSNTANYDLTIRRNRVNILVGTEMVKERFLQTGIYKEGFALQDVDYFNLDAGTGRTTNSGNETGNQLLSYFGKLNYSWDNKYLASVTVRNDGSSRFGENNRFGLFPAASVGWKISDEKFVSDNIKFISNLKLRGGVGLVGNQDIGDNARFGLYETNYGGASGNRSTGTAYPIAGQNSGALPSGYVSLQAENNNLKWESTQETNIGLDFGFFNETLTGSVDFFKRETKDILIRPPYAAILGEGKSQWVNGATKDNRGFELLVNYQNKIGAFSYSVSGNVSSFKDKITFLPASVVKSYPGNVEKTILSHSQTAIFGYVTDGLFQNQAEVDAHAAQTGKGIGRLRYVDLNKDGKIDPLDQDWLGNQLPDFVYGLNLALSYKKISLSAFLQGVHGIYVFNGIKASTDLIGGSNSGMNYGARVLQAWTPQNTASTIPALSLVNANNESRTSNYFIENGSYLKLRNLQIAYDLHDYVRKIGINDLRVYVLCQNLLTVKKTKGDSQYTGPDPENPANLYPRPTTYTIGLNLMF